MRAFYNDNDAYCCQWLRNLIEAGELPNGDVSEKDIREIRASDLDGYDQIHLFAGCGGWPLALELAGWGDGPVWTASCPCPPFSVAGKPQTCPECASRVLVWCPRRTGFAICADCGHAWLADARHLWPEVWRLAAERRPQRIIGEQVASKDAEVWLAGVRASMEILGYRVGAPDLPAAGVGAPHIRQRLWWVANANGSRQGTQQRDNEKVRNVSQAQRQPKHGAAVFRRSSSASGLAPSDGGDARAERLQRGGQHGQQPQDSGAGRLGNATRSGRQQERANAGGRGQGSGAQGREQRPGSDEPTGGLGDANGPRHEIRARLAEDDGAARQSTAGQAVEQAGAWSAFDLIPCGDGKARRVEPGTFPLAHGIPNRVGRLRAYGNAINAELGAEFVRAVMETIAQ